MSRSSATPSAPPGCPPANTTVVGASSPTAKRCASSPMAPSRQPGTLDRALRVITAPLPTGAGLTLPEAAQTLATTAARILGLANTGLLAPGHTADLVAIDATGRIRLTLIAGQIAHDARADG
ncbi:MAG: hypothetical protein U0232_16200 [Thermomicrobiales bacterium]